MESNHVWRDCFFIRILSVKIMTEGSTTLQVWNTTTKQYYNQQIKYISKVKKIVLVISTNSIISMLTVIIKYCKKSRKDQIGGSGFGLWCLTPLSTKFQLYRGGNSNGMVYKSSYTLL